VLTAAPCALWRASAGGQRPPFHSRQPWPQDHPSCPEGEGTALSRPFPQQTILKCCAHCCCSFFAAGCPGTGWAGPLSGLPLPAAPDRRARPLQKMPDQGETAATQHSSSISSTIVIPCAGIVRAGAALGLPCRRPSRCLAAPPIPRDTPSSARRGEVCSVPRQLHQGQTQPGAVLALSTAATQCGSTSGNSDARPTRADR